MPRWLFRILARVRGDSALGRVKFTDKAQNELLEFEPPLEEREASEILAHLTPGEFVRRLRSDRTGEWLYVFRPRVYGVPAYVKLVPRSRCVIISFHEDKEDVE